MKQPLFSLTPVTVKVAERDVTRQCRDFLLLRGYWPARLHTGRFKTLDDARIITGNQKGTPDYAFLHPIYPGFLLELKRPGGKLSHVQDQKIFELQRGYRLAVAVVDNAVALQQWLDEHEARTRTKWRDYALSNRAL